MVFGYNADSANGSTNQSGTYQHAQNLILHLRNNRLNHKVRVVFPSKPVLRYRGYRKGKLTPTCLASDKEAKRPIVFLGHSYGCIVIKQTLVNDSHESAGLSILQQTKLLVFLGGPHHGSHLLDKPIAKVAASTFKMAGKSIPRAVEPMLKPGSDEQFILNSDFMHIKGRIEIINFYEQQEKKKFLMSDLVVDKDSAVFASEHSESFGVDRDHESLVRFRDANDDFYHTICQTLLRKTGSFLRSLAKEERRQASERMIKACLQSLDYRSSSAAFGKGEQAHEGTLKWLWNDDSAFLLWLQRGSGIFAVTGKPGSGKSVLMHEIGRQVHRRYWENFGAIISHCFKKRGVPREHTVDGFLRAAISQLLRQCPSSFDSIFDEWRFIAREIGLNDGTRSGDIKDSDDEASASWPIDTLDMVFRSLVNHCVSHGTRLCFIIDALEECSDGFDQVSELLNFLGAAPAKPTCIDKPDNKSAVSVCFSSREVPGVMTSPFAGHIIMEHQNKPDITKVINDRWTKISSLIGSGNDHEIKQLKQTLIRRADGIFLWACLALERVQSALSDGATMAELKEAINEIPDELSQLYSLLVKHINPKYASEADSMFALVLSARRPLSLKELRYITALMSCPSVLSIQDLNSSPNIIHDDTTMMRRIRSRCGGLLEVSDRSYQNESALERGQRAIMGRQDSNTTGGPVVQFIHESVKDSLVSSMLLSPGGKDAEGLIAHGHEILAESCLHFLSLQEVQGLARDIRSGLTVNRFSRERRQEELPLLSYAVESCFHHCQEAEKLGVSQAVQIAQCFNEDEDDSEVFENYVSLYASTQPGGARYSFRPSLLQLTVENNLASYVDMHLAHTAADINTLLDNGKTYLQIAVDKEHLETARVLLAYGANPNSPPPMAGTGIPPLAAACRKGNFDMVHLLLDKGADIAFCNVSLPEGVSNLAFRWAAYSAKEDIVRLLFEHDPETLSHPEVAMMALHGVASATNELWREKGSALYNGLSRTHTLLYEKAKRSEELMGMPELISSLTGDEVMRHVSGTTAPTTAANYWFWSGCRHEVLERLFEIGDIFTDSIMRGNSSELTALLDVACGHGELASVKLLIEKGANPLQPIYSDRENREHTCLHTAAGDQSSTSVLEYLLAYGLPVDSLDGDHSTPLHKAAVKQTEAHVDLLLRYSADKSIRDEDDHLPFHFAILNPMLSDQMGMLEKLMSKESDLWSPTRSGQTPLHIAVATSSLLVVDWLLEACAAKGHPECVTAVDMEDRTVLHSAVAAPTTHSPDIVARLLESPLPGGHTLDVDTRDAAGRTAMHYVFWAEEAWQNTFVLESPKDKLAKVKLLLKHGADLGAKDTAGNTPLHYAAWKGDKDTVQLLLDHGADPNAMDIHKLRPLDLAEDDDVRELLEDITDC